MPYLNSYDYNKFAPQRKLRVIHKQATKSLPEIGALPNVPIDGVEYDTPVLLKEGDAPIFRAFSQGALSGRSDWDDVTNKTFGMDRKVESILRAEKETDEASILGRERRFNAETEITLGNMFERIVLQFYKGQSHEEGGFGGLPGAVKYKVDALKAEWNENKDYTSVSDADFPAANNSKLYSVYLVYAAPAPTIESPGMKWIWGNKRTIYPTGERRVVDLADADNGGTYEGYRQHFNGQVGLGFTTDIDVIEIANVPAFALDGFYLDNVISNALTLFPRGRKANRIFIHKLVQNRAHRQIQNTARAGGSSTIQIVDSNDTGRQSQKLVDFFDGSDLIPFVTSEVMPTTGLQTISATTQSAVYDEIHVNAAIA